ARPVDARALVLQRRSAVDFDGSTGLDLASFVRMLDATRMASCLRSLDAPRRVHLALFVHRIVGLAPGLYVLPRTARGESLLSETVGETRGWEPVADLPGELPLVRVASGDARELGRDV